MKTSLWIATLFAVGAGAAGAGATIHMLGSDTWFNMATQAVVNSGASTIIYTGSGSGNGESAMIQTIEGTLPSSRDPQQIAPMSRFFNNNMCKAVPAGVPLANQQTAEGIAVNLDGLAILASGVYGGAAACDGTPATDCTPQAAGAAFNTTITTASHGSYTFTSWRDVLAVVYGGKSHAGWPEGTSCSSDVRTSIVNNWSNFYETQCTATDPSQGGCTQIQHAFRRDDASGTSDAFASLLALSPSPAASSNNFFGASPFCNVVVGGEQFGTAGSPPVPKAPSGPVINYCNAAWNNCNLNPTDSTAANIGYYPTDYQDNDPIRRPCIGTGTASGNRASEQVCDRDGTLGLVLPIVPTDFIPGEGGNQYPVNKCNGGSVFAAAPSILNQTNVRTAFGRCPNGDRNFGGGSCGIPVDSTGSTACIVDNSYVSPFTVDAATVFNGVAPNLADGRVYNAHVFAGKSNTQFSNSQYVNDTFGRNIVGGWYRIHSLRPAVIATTPYVPVVCTAKDATDQIGCLVQASPCSIGFAGKGAAQWGAHQTPAVASNNVALKVNQIEPLLACVQGTQVSPPKFVYPIARKMYLDSIVGFGNLTGLANDTAGDQLKLAQYMSLYKGPGNGGMDDVVTAQGFIPMPSVINPNPAFPGVGQPYCEDYNEQLLCGAASNTNGCQTTPPSGIPGTTNQTTCGNSVVEAYEDCDNGTANSDTGPPGSCSTICRTN